MMQFFPSLFTVACFKLHEVLYFESMTTEVGVVLKTTSTLCKILINFYTITHTMHWIKSEFITEFIV